MTRSRLVALFVRVSFAAACAVPLSAQCANVVLSSQAEVDAFNCSVITGSLTIRSGAATPIGNLNALSVLTSVGGNLTIERNTTLTNTDGLGNLQSIGGGFSVYNNSALTSLSDLGSLTVLGGQLWVVDNPALVDTAGLGALASAGAVLFQQNAALVDLDLRSLWLVYGDVFLHSCSQLSSLAGLFDLVTVGGDLRIGSTGVRDLNGLANLTAVVGALDIRDNPSLTSFCGIYQLLQSGQTGSVNLSNNGAPTSVNQILVEGPCEGQIVMPPVDEWKYTSTAKGFFFLCPVRCLIRGLNVDPGSLGGQGQVCEILDLGTSSPPLWPNYRPPVAQLFYDNSTRAGERVPCNVLLQPGRVYGIFGYLSDIGQPPWFAYPEPNVNPFGGSGLLGHRLTIAGLRADANIAGNGGNRPVQTTYSFLGMVGVDVVAALGIHAHFSVNVRSVPEGGTVAFVDETFTSEAGGLQSWAWDFDGDGTIDSTQQNPTFTYNTCGVYDVTLTVGDGVNVPRTYTRQGVIEVGLAPIAPSFTALPISGHTYQFTDTSTPSPANWAWDFEGDGTIDSTVQNPIHTYDPCATVVTPTLSVWDTTCGGPWSASQSITFIPVMQPSFTHQQLGGNRVQFQDATTPTPTSWAWDFDGDGVTDSTLQNPAWTFPSSCTPVTVALTTADVCQGPVVTSRAILPNGLLGAVGGTIVHGDHGHYLDIEVTSPGGIEICSVVHKAAAYQSAYEYEVYLTSGTHVGKVGNPFRWRLMGTGSATAPWLNGMLGLSHAPLDQPFYLPKGKYGLMIHVTSATPWQPVLVSNHYNANQPPFVGPELTIHAPNSGAFAGCTSDAALGPRTASNAVWNGGFQYTVCSPAGGQGASGLFGLGCFGWNGTAEMVPHGVPTIGSTFDVDVTNLPQGIAIMIIGLDNETSGFGPLPFDATAFGMPGCKLWVSDDVTEFLPIANPSSWSLTIPNDSAFLCLQYYLQALVYAPGYNAAGWVLSDAHGLVIGN